MEEDLKLAIETIKSHLQCLLMEYMKWEVKWVYQYNQIYFYKLRSRFLGQ